ncbi:MAG: tetratricopeptide repeat protein [Candidatus Eisenbacteria bacterium]
MNAARMATPTHVRPALSRPWTRRARWRGGLLAVLALGVALACATPTHAQDGEPVLEATVARSAMGSGRTQPADLRDVNAWVAWKSAQQIDALPLEARLFYRRGLLAREGGQTQEALTNVRGAIELDPQFLQPHITLASWALFSDPAQTLLHCAAVVDLCRHDFNTQLDLIASALILGIEALFAGLMFAGLFLVFLRRHELSHSLLEELSRTISHETARWWVPVVLLLPFLAGLGVTLPVLGFLAYLWTVLRPRERVLTVMLAVAAVGAPAALSMLDRYTLALRTDSRPFHELPLVANVPFSPERQARLADAVQRDPDDGFAQFALAWHARKGGQLETAEQAYRAAVKAWPEASAPLTNLGNVLAMRGRTDEALERYASAVKLDPENAAAHFNSAQLLTRRFEYTAANNELRQASALDFELVKQYQSRAGTAGMLPLIDVWPPADLFWQTLHRAQRPRGTQPLPMLLRGRMEASGWPFTIATIFVLGLAGWFGQWQHRRLPLRVCSNCGVIVCRRCAKRRREAALCPACDRIGAGAETAEFSRVLMLQHRGRQRDRDRLARTALAALVPGFGLLAHHRVFGPTLLIAITWLLGRLAIGFSPPFSLSPRLAFPGGEVPVVVVVAGLLFVYTWSLGGYFLAMNRERLREAQLESTTRGRITQATRRSSTLAA